MLKLFESISSRAARIPAAFGRLCVETVMSGLPPALPYQPPSGGCVLKQFHDKLQAV